MESIHPGREELRNSAPCVMMVTPLKSVRDSSVYDRPLAGALRALGGVLRPFPIFGHANPQFGQVYAATTLIGMRRVISELIAGERRRLFYSSK